MKRVDWVDKATGDILFYAGQEEISRAIIDIEKLENSTTVAHPWVPSHVAIVGPADKVTEAWLDLHESSVAAVHPITKYGSGENCQIWRPSGDPVALAANLATYIAKYNTMRYGVLNIVGFEIQAFEEKFLHHVVENPLTHGWVCSQGGLLFLRMLRSGEESWADGFDVKEATPDMLLRICESSH